MDYRDKSVAILGLGREGKALARFLACQGARVSISDLKPAQELGEALAELESLPIRYFLGGHPEELLESEVIFLSPGVPRELPILKEARRRKIQLDSLIGLVLRSCPAQVIGITGSGGKSTTTSLVGKMLQEAGFTAWVGGNIGRPLLEEMESMRPEHWVVLELSSFQLEMVDASPHLAAILNIFPDHLDRHGSLAEYVAAKANILRFQVASDWAVLGWEDERAWGLSSQVNGGLAGFGLEEKGGDGAFVRAKEIVLRLGGREERLCPVERVRLRGKHNLNNALAAAVLARLAGAGREAIVRVISEFEGLSHRLELVREVEGVGYYNDSIATTPDRTMAALASFSEPVVLLAGGRGKKLPLESLAKAIREKVRLLIIYGEEASTLAQALEADLGWAGVPQVVQVEDLAEAVEEARARSYPGEVVLLSPAFTSFDQYRDYAERGEHFRELVRRL